MDALGGFMALCPPVFAPDGSALYTATGNSIVALSPTTLSLLQVIPTPKRHVVQLAFLRASDSQLLILSRHKFSIYNTRTGDFSLEVTLPEKQDAQDKRTAALLQHDLEFVHFVQCEKSDSFIFMLEAKNAKDRTHFLVTYSLLADGNKANKAFFDLSGASKLLPLPITPDQLTLRRTSSGLITSEGLLYAAVDCTLFFARLPASKLNTPQELPDKFSAIKHDANITQLVTFNHKANYGFLMGDLRGILYRFDGIPQGSTVSGSKHVKFHWNKNGISALTVANAATATPQILIGGEETILVNLSAIDHTPQFGPAVIGPIRYISCPQMSIFSPSSLSYLQTACIVTATNTIYSVDIASNAVLAQRHGLVSHARNLRYTPKETPGIFLYPEDDSTSILADASPGDVQLLHGVENLPHSVFLPQRGTDIVTILQRNKIYSRSEISDPPHVLHFIVLNNGSLIVAVTGLKLVQNVHQEEVLYVYRKSGSTDDATCLAQIFRPHSTPVKRLAPMTMSPNCDLFVSVSQLEAKVFTFMNNGLVEIFNWDICDGFEAKPITVEAAGISRDGLYFCAVIGDAQLDKSVFFLRIYRLVYSETEKSGNGCPLPVGILIQDELDLLKYRDNTTYKSRRVMCSVGNTSVCVSSPSGVFYHKFSTNSAESSPKKHGSEKRKPIAVALPVTYQLCLAPHCDSKDCHYVFGASDDSGFIFKLADGSIKEKAFLFEKRHKRDMICGLDCSADGRVYALVSTRASGRHLLYPLGQHTKHEIYVEEQPQVSMGSGPIVGPISVATDQISISIGDVFPRKVSEEPSHRITKYSIQLGNALDALF